MHSANRASVSAQHDVGEMVWWRCASFYFLWSRRCGGGGGFLVPDTPTRGLRASTTAYGETRRVTMSRGGRPLQRINKPSDPQDQQRHSNTPQRVGDTVAVFFGVQLLPSLNFFEGLFSFLWLILFRKSYA